MSTTTQPYRELAPRAEPPSDPRYRPMPRRAYRLRAALRAVPLVLFLVFMWIAAFSQWALPFSVGATAFVALVSWFAVLRVRQARASARLAAGQVRTTALLAEGRMDDAAVATDATLERARDAPAVHCILLVQRAQLFLRLGDADRALSLLEAVRASAWLEHARLAQGASSMASALAMTQLARGDLDDAERWQREAHAKIREKDRAQLLPLDALIDARRARFAEAAERIDEAWPTAEETLAPRALDLLRLVRAFAADALGEPTRPAGDADVDYLVRAWPELRAFTEKSAPNAPSPVLQPPGSMTGKSTAT